MFERHPHRIRNNIATKMDEVMAASAQVLLAMGESEVEGSRRIEILWTVFQTNPGVMGPEVWSEEIDHTIYTWPQSLWDRLPWGPEPHFGLLGGLSGWGFELGARPPGGGGREDGPQDPLD